MKRVYADELLTWCTAIVLISTVDAKCTIDESKRKIEELKVKRGSSVFITEDERKDIDHEILRLYGVIDVAEKTLEKNRVRSHDLEGLVSFLERFQQDNP